MPGHRYIGDQWRNGPIKIVIADDSRGGRDFSGRDAIEAVDPVFVADFDTYEALAGR